MVRIEVRGTNQHNDTYSIVVEDDRVEDAVKAAKRALGELKFGEYTLWIDAAAK